MKNEKFYKGVFTVAALYDLILGFAFFFFYRGVYGALGIALPEFASYVQLSAAFVFVQGLSYYFVARNLERNVDLVKVGLVYKIAYAGVALFYWFQGGLPHALFALFGLLDIGFVVLFVLYLRDFRASPASPASAQ